MKDNHGFVFYGVITTFAFLTNCNIDIEKQKISSALSEKEFQQIKQWTFLTDQLISVITSLP